MEGGIVSDIYECSLNPNVRIPREHVRRILPIIIFQSSWSFFSFVHCVLI
jgi:hypothetical protein